MSDLKKIAIHGVPRSGTTWLGSIFDSHERVLFRHQPLFSYAFKGALHASSNAGDVSTFFRMLAESEDDFVTQKDAKRKGLVPEFRKRGEPNAIAYKEARYHHIIENLLSVDSEVVVLGIVRNPKSVISSWFNAPKEFDSTWSKEREWYEANKKNGAREEEFYGFKKWLEVCKLFIRLSHEYPDRFKVVNYKMLLEDPVNEVKEIFSFCGLDFNQQTYDFLNMEHGIDRSEEHYSVYRISQVDNKWVDHLPPSIAAEIDKIVREEGLSLFCE
jgi:hypothetical protein